MFEDVRKELEESFIFFDENFLLSKFTTFRIGGKCPLFVRCDDPKKLIQCVNIFHKYKIQFLIVGFGSNLLISDQGLSVPVISFAAQNFSIKHGGNNIIASASTLLDDVVNFAAEHGLKGLSCASGIPGTIGGAVVGNAGAFGSQIGDHIKQIEVVDLNGKVSSLDKRDLKFSYRNSIFKKRKSLILLSVHFELEKGNKGRLIDERNELLELRQEKHPDYHKIACAGSFFKNIIYDDGSRKAAGWFLDQAGCKGLSVGNAAVFEKHANIIINKGNASAQDVCVLADLMNNRVKEKFGFKLEPEVRLIGDFS